MKAPFRTLNPSFCVRAGALLAATVAGNFLPVHAHLPRPASVHSPNSVHLSSPRLASYARLPLAFEVNQGQTDRRVQFLAHGPGRGLFLTSTGATLALKTAKGKNGPGKTEAVRMTLAGVKGQPQAVGENPLPGKVNYLRGRDRTKWQVGVPTFGRVRYKSVYPGVDLVYYGTGGKLEYDFVVAPGADPKAIGLTFEGARGIRKESNGALALQMAGGSVRWQKPVVYQTVNGKRQQVAGRYQVRGRQVRFAVGAYNKSKPLVIDPVLVYSTLLGSSSDGAQGVAADEDGNAYVTGTTTSTNFPVTVGVVQGVAAGSGDVFVSKFNPAGSALVYSTFLGGTDRDYGNAIAVDSLGDVCVAGTTSSSDFPVTDRAAQSTLGGNDDAFLVRLNADGSDLLYSSYLGGQYTDVATGVAVDAGDNAYVTGFTTSADFPTTNFALQTAAGNSYNSFVAKVDLGANLIYSTYLGGGSTCQAEAIAVDAGGNAYVTGYSQVGNTDFPTTPGAFQATNKGRNDVFVAKLTADGSTLAWATLLGGDDDDRGRAIAVDAAGSAFVVGETESLMPAFPTRNPIQAQRGGSSDGFLTKLAPDGKSLVYSTLLGGSKDDSYGDEGASAVAVDETGRAWVAGYSDASDFPLTLPLQSRYGGYGDVFVLQVNPAGTALEYSTYLGGKAEDAANAVALGPYGLLVAGYTDSTDFPLTSSAFQKTHSTYGDAFVALLYTAEVTGLSLSPTSVTAGQTATGTVTLSRAAPPGGALVTLTTTDLTATSLPTQVLVPVGQTSATFTITAKAVTTTKTVTIGASRSGGSRFATLTVKPAGVAALSTLTLNPNPVTGGLPATGTVTLSAPAPTGGAVITLARSSALVGIPASVTVLAGKTAANFTIATTEVNANASAIISAAYKGVTKTAALTIAPRPNAVKGLALLPTTVYSGASSTATVTLTTVAPTGGVKVALASTNPNVATVPASVTVLAGKQQAQFTVTTKEVVAADSTVTILASANLRRAEAVLTVLRQPQVAAIAVVPERGIVGLQREATVRLDAPARVGGRVVLLSSSNPGVYVPPPSVTVAAGQTKVTFSVFTEKDPAAPTQVVIAAKAGTAGPAVTTSFTVLPTPPHVASLTLYPSTVVGGKSVTGEVRLNKPALTGGREVPLESSNTAVAIVPVVITIKAGETQGQFTITTFKVNATVSVAINAYGYGYGGPVTRAVLTVNK